MSRYRAVESGFAPDVEDRSAEGSNEVEDRSAEGSNEGDPCLADLGADGSSTVRGCGLLRLCCRLSPEERSK